MSSFLPIFVVNRSKLIHRLQKLSGDFGILATSAESDTFLRKLRCFDKPYFIDSAVFQKSTVRIYGNPTLPWYVQIKNYFEEGRWKRDIELASRIQLQTKLGQFLDRCDRFSPDYVIAPDVFGEPLISLYLAKIALQEYSNKPRPYQLVGVIQAGEVLYNWPKQHPQVDAFLPHYRTPKSFLMSLIGEYKRIGYQFIALGGLLKADPRAPMGLKFGLSNEALDELLAWSRPDLVLGGLALTRLPVLKKHQVWADSSNWIWWDKRYDRDRFENWDALQSVID